MRLLAEDTLEGLFLLPQFVADAIHTWIRQGRVRAVRLPDASGRLYVLAADLKLDGWEENRKETGSASGSREHRAALRYLRDVGVVE